MGWPVTHSKSPRLFDHWFARHGIPGRYVPLAVEPQDFATVYQALPKAGFRGVNVTLPHKKAALALADAATDTARAIGAANMIRFDPAEGIVADNTDAFGFIESLRARAPAWDPGLPALVLGAGGAARAVLHALAEAGVPEIRLANRTRDKAEALADALPGPIVVVEWGARAEAAAGAGLLVNTTSLGMTGQPPLEMALDAMSLGAVLDIVYAPLETPLLAAAKARGLTPVDGLGMLLHQARPAFAAWFGTDPEVTTALREACLS